MSDLSNFVRRESAYGDGARSHPAVGIVTSYNKKTHSVKLKLMPEENETGWVPVGSHHIGGGFGIVAGPNVGDQFVVGFLDGDRNTPFIQQRLFSDDQKPPEVESGEMLIKHETKGSMFFDKKGAITVTHKDGGTIKFDKDGHVTVDSKNKNISVDAGTGGISHTAQSHSFKGNVNVDGNVSATQNIGAPTLSGALT